MIKIHFQEPTDADWLQWCADCAQARDEAITAVTDGEKPEITDLYKDDRLKNRYKASDGPFYGKCAYCETKVTENQPGDIEHFRPKGGIEYNDGSKVTIALGDGSMVEHPGYYWLAYDWCNLLLACIKCNRPENDRQTGRKLGKRNKFPAPVDSVHASQPGGEKHEHPLLLNPMWDDPSEHLQVDSSGVISDCESARGRECIEIFALNDRTDLVDARASEYNRAKDLAVLLAFDLLRETNDAGIATQAENCEDIRLGITPFAMSGRAALDAVWERTKSIGRTPIAGDRQANHE